MALVLQSLAFVPSAETLAFPPWLLTVGDSKRTHTHKKKKKAEGKTNFRAKIHSVFRSFIAPASAPAGSPRSSGSPCATAAPGCTRDPAQPHAAAPPPRELGRPRRDGGVGLGFTGNQTRLWGVGQKGSQFWGVGFWKARDGI